ncbi:vesicle-fusing atpase [Nicotiana attenuata]|uniref:Vesicle-fusing ATPase n=1 Tax=Nicotiana attenuata TaxID=49451 RepID=A0A314L3M7_NICAT|nr:vesicle-fusing atpase [Nicotiana attenuata]
MPVSSSTTMAAFSSSSMPASSSASLPAPASEIQPTSPPSPAPDDNQIFQVFRKDPHYENFAYVNSKKLKLFPLQILKKRFLRDNKFTVDASVPDDHVAINYLHADFLDLLYGEVVRLKSFTIPPPPDLELTTLGLEVEDTGKRIIKASHPHITKDFLQQFKVHIFCKKQLLFFEHRGARVHMRVSFATQKAGNVGRGKLVKKTEIHFFESDLFKIVRGPEIFSHFMGSSEGKIRDIFNSAINDLNEKGVESPLHVIVFDELDSIARARGTNPSDTTCDRVVNQLLTMIDGYSELSNVLLVGTTNQLELIDKALLRPGRFELHMAIGLPNKDGRKEILRINVKRLQWKGALSSSVNLDELVEKTDGFSGADLAALIQTSFFLAVTRAVPPNIADTVWTDTIVEQEDIDIAFATLQRTKSPPTSFLSPFNLFIIYGSVVAGEF